MGDVRWEVGQMVVSCSRRLQEQSPGQGGTGAKSVSLFLTSRGCICVCVCVCVCLYVCVCGMCLYCILYVWMDACVPST